MDGARGREPRFKKDTEGGGPGGGVGRKRERRHVRAHQSSGSGRGGSGSEKRWEGKMRENRQDGTKRSREESIAKTGLHQLANEGYEAQWGSRIDKKLDNAKKIGKSEELRGEGRSDFGKGIGGQWGGIFLLIRTLGKTRNAVKDGV